jgi:hypothetical protein
MQVSHELPLSLLGYSKKWNDYEYCLPHLIDKHEEYRLHFQKARLKNRFIIMDNGLFEGVTHTTEDLIDKINMIRPNVFIVPDAWNDDNTTFKNAKYWINTIKSNIPESVNLMVVMQGKDISDIRSLYTSCVDLGYRHISFNHSSIAYQSLFPHENKLVSQMMGRILLINKLSSWRVIDKEAYHHLLGCSLYQEFAYYKGYDFIKSVDTSNPIILGAKNQRYEGIILEKPSEKIEDFMEKDLSGQFEDIIFNVQKFKEIIK